MLSVLNPVYFKIKKHYFLPPSGLKSLPSTVRSFLGAALKSALEFMSLTLAVCGNNRDWKRSEVLVVPCSVRHKATSGKCKTSYFSNARSVCVCVCVQNTLIRSLALIHASLLWSMSILVCLSWR